MDNYGVSVSVKQCRNFGISSTDCIEWLIKRGGFKRFRLMSYWDEIESSPGKYNFKELDQQIALIAKHNSTISLCLGARQPRWPENHWPKWALELSKEERTNSLLQFIQKVVERYKNQPSITSYQLENEALLKNFGRNPEIDRSRLRQELQLVKKLDSSRPIAMSTSTSWGIPLRRPIGDIVGFSYYQILYNPKKRAYTTAFHKPWLQRFKASLIKTIWNRPSFIHELQLEPWGPTNIWDMSEQEQSKSMSLEQIRHNLKLARQTGLAPIDLWGGEWWYWCYLKNGNTKIIDAVLD